MDMQYNETLVDTIVIEGVDVRRQIRRPAMWIKA